MPLEDGKEMFSSHSAFLLLDNRNPTHRRNPTRACNYPTTLPLAALAGVSLLLPPPSAHQQLRVAMML